MTVPALLPVPQSAFARVFAIESNDRIELFDLTERIERLVAESGVQQGTASVQSLHTTAAVFVNEWQRALRDDYRTLLERLVPDDTPWAHNDPRLSDCERGNAAAHLRALLLGFSARLQIDQGRLVLGRWQRVILTELDGPRTRDISIQVDGRRA